MGMRPKRLIFAALCWLVLLGPVGPAYGLEFKLTLNVPASFTWGMGALKFAELVKEETKGKITIKPYFSGALVKGRQTRTPKLVADGKIDCAIDSTINTAHYIPQANIFTLPFFVNSFVNLDKMEKGLTGQAIFGAMSKKGLKPLAWGENGFRQIALNKKPASPGSNPLAGLKMRVTGGSAIVNDIFKALEAEPTNISWPQTLKALKKDEIMGQENPISILLSLKSYEYNRTILLWNYAADPLMIYWNKKQFDSFSDEFKKAIVKAAQKAGRYQKALARNGLDGGQSKKILKDEFGYSPKIENPINFLVEKGVAFIGSEDEQKKHLLNLTRQVHTRWIPRIGRSVYLYAEKDMAQK